MNRMYDLLSNAVLEQYDAYRKVSNDLVNKIAPSCLVGNTLMQCARMLRIQIKNDNFVLNTPSELGALMDFALNEHLINGTQNAMEFYRDNFGFANETEKEILDAFIASHTSLFKIMSISKEKSMLILNDILEHNNREPKEICLIDRALSKSATTGMLLFTRLITFRQFTMTSGTGFIFRGQMEKYILRKYTQINSTKSDTESKKKFVFFFKLNRTSGVSASIKAV